MTNDIMIKMTGMSPCGLRIQRLL